MAILQAAYGMAIRQNVGKPDAVERMKRAVGGVVWHNCVSTESKEVQHQFCPAPPNTWCKYKTDKNHVPKLQLPVETKKLIEPIFKDLSTDELLKRCTHSRTQNANESLNARIWKRVPKETYVERTVLSKGVASAVISFNHG